MNLKRLVRFVPTLGRFLVVGLSGTVVNLAVLWGLAGLGMDHLLAAVVATEVAIINNFIWNDLWTFKHTSDRIASAGGRFLRFQCIAGITACMTLGLFGLFNQGMHMHFMLAQFYAIGFSTIVNFCVNGWLTWGLFAPYRAALTSFGTPLSNVKIVKEIENVK